MRKGHYNLFCLHHAGGAKYAYAQFAHVAPSFLNVRLLEYPGRGQRVNEILLKDVVVLAKTLVSEIKEELVTPYAIYGHSMGALVGFLMAREIRAAGYPLPKLLFVTGCEGPSTRSHDKIRHLMPKDELLEELRKLGGISEEVFSESEIMNFFLPIIRADFEAIETYKYAMASPLEIPINVAIGMQEEISQEQAISWQHETKFPLEIMHFQGNHFFIFNHIAKLIKIIAEKLSE